MFVEQADAASGQDKLASIFYRVGFVGTVKPNHRRDHACRTVGRRRYDLAAGGVFFVDGHRINVQPIEQDFGAIVVVASLKRIPKRWCAAFDF